MSKKYTTNFLEDTNGSTGSTNQVLVSTAAGVDWVDGSGSGIIGGPYLPLTGGTMTGSIAMSNQNITGVNQITINDPGEGIVFTGTATMYLNAVDDATDSILKLTNATQLNLNSTARITNLVDPSSAQDAATRNYVDTEVGNIPSGLAFEGNWNASTDTPTLAGTTQDNGKFWIVSVAGSTNLSGITDWAVGDWAIYVDNGAGTDAWQKVDNSSSLAGQGAAGKVAFWSTTSNVSFNTNFSYDGTYLTSPRIRVGDGTDGFFYSDSAGRTAFTGGDFYIQSSVGNAYNYAANNYHGGSSGDNQLFRGNPLTGDNWIITAAGAATFTTATITGNTLLGNSNGDYVHINDRLFVGATDSGNAEFWFGEGTTGDVNYGARWYWDSGYTHKWFTVNNSTETLMMDYATNVTSKVNWYRDIDIQDNDILIDSSHGFINSGSWTRNATPSGYIDFGPANTSHAHIYTDRPNFYFNKSLTVNGSSIVNQNDIRSSIFYDVDNTAYYADFSNGQIVLGGTGRIQGIDTVSAGTDAANKAYVDLEIATRTPLNDIRSLGTTAFTNGTSPNITTAQVMAEIEADGGFDSYSSVFKTSWSYAGNYNLTDAGDFTETAGSSWITWTDNSSDTARGNITALAIAPNSGSSAGGVFIYNDQGGDYSPGWRQVWTNTTDGAGSGLDADLLDGEQGSYYLDYANFTGTPTIPSVGNGQIDGRTSGLGLSGSMDATANQSGNTTFTVTSNAVTAATASTIAYRTTSGDLNVRLLRSNYQDQTTISGAMAYRVNNGADNYTRYCSSPSAIRNFLGVPASGDLNNYLLDTTDTFTGALTINGDIRGNGQQLVLNAGESAGYATGQTNEYVYANAENGLIVSSSPDNWGSGWAGRNTAHINKADGSSVFPGAVTIAGDLTVNGGDIILGGTGRIQGIDTVSSGTDAANKTYVDAQGTNFLENEGSFISGDTLFEILETDTTADVRTKLSNPSGSIVRIDDYTAPAGGCFQLNNAYISFGLPQYHKLDDDQEYTFELWGKFISGTDTDQKTYLGSSFYGSTKNYLGNSQRYWGESGFNIDSNTNNDGWYFMSGTLGPDRGGNTGEIPTAAHWMKLIMLLNYSTQANTMRYCGLKVYKSGHKGAKKVTSIYRKALGSQASSSAGQWIGEVVMDTAGALHAPNITLADGIYHKGDTNTYINFLTDTIQMATAGSPRVYINSAGSVGIGTTNPGAKLEVYGSSPNILINNTVETDAGIVFSDAQAGTGQMAAIKFNSSDEKLKFFVNDETSQRMVIDTSGNVGINTISPQAKLHVSGGSSIETTLIVGAEGTGNDKSARVFLNEGEGGVANSKDYGFSLAYDGQGAQYGGLSANQFGILRHNNSAAGGAVMVMNRTNNNTTFTGTVTGTNFILSSDERLKENIEKACDNRIKADWKTFELKTDKGQKRYGVIAQELEKTNPEFVREDTQGFKSVAYIDLLIAKIAELEARLEKAGI